MQVRYYCFQNISSEELKMASIFQLLKRVPTQDIDYSIFEDDSSCSYEIEEDQSGK